MLLHPRVEGFHVVLSLFLVHVHHGIGRGLCSQPLRPRLVHLALAKDCGDINVDVPHILLHEVVVLLVLFVSLRSVFVLAEEDFLGFLHLLLDIRVLAQVFLKRLLAQLRVLPVVLSQISMSCAA